MIQFVTSLNKGHNYQPWHSRNCSVLTCESEPVSWSVFWPFVFFCSGHSLSSGLCSVAWALSSVNCPLQASSSGVSVDVGVSGEVVVGRGRTQGTSLPLSLALGLLHLPGKLLLPPTPQPGLAPVSRLLLGSCSHRRWGLPSWLSPGCLCMLTCPGLIFSCARPSCGTN